MTESVRPYFWSEPKLQQTMLSERKIIVSVTRKKAYWSLKGAGLLRGELAAHRQRILQFENWRNLSWRLQNLQWQERAQTLAIDIEVLGRRYPLELALSESRETMAATPAWKIFFRSTSASVVKGIEGRLEVVDLGRQEVEMNMIAISDRLPTWAPDWLLTIAAEGIMHHIAERLRNELESSYIEDHKTK